MRNALLPTLNMASKGHGHATLFTLATCFALATLFTPAIHFNHAARRGRVEAVAQLQCRRLID